MRYYKSQGNCIRQKPPKSGKFSPCRNYRHPLCCLLFCKTVDASQGFPLLKVIWFVFTAPDLRNTQLLMSVVVLWYDRLTQLTPNNNTNLRSRSWCKVHHVVHVSCRVHAWCAASQPCCCYYSWSGMHTWQPFNFCNYLASQIMAIFLHTSAKWPKHIPESWVLPWFIQ